MEFRKLLEKHALGLTRIVDAFVSSHLPPFLSSKKAQEFKNVNDPVWKTIRLRWWEVAVVDTPLFQRLRRIRQLGVAELVFPGAGYSRFEHSVGTLQAMEMLCSALNSSKAGCLPDRDKSLLRLAALLHDIGHCAYSHVSEVFYGQLPVAEDLVLSELRTVVENHCGHRPSCSELLAAAIVSSSPFGAYLRSLNAADISDIETPDWLATLITGGYPEPLRPFLTQLLTGPFDADKLDYMQRDCLMAGIPLPLDVPRLVDKVRPVPVKISDLPKSAQAGFRLPPEKEVQVLGVALSGSRAIEEMLIARVILFDKLYYHSKIRAAEAMVRRALGQIRKSGQLDDLKAFLALDDFKLSAFGDPEFDASRKMAEGASHILRALRERRLPKRAFCFAQPLVAPGTDEYAWTNLSRACLDEEDCTALEIEIANLAQTLLEKIDGKHPDVPPNVFISMPDSSRVHTSIYTFLITNNGAAVPFRAAAESQETGSDSTPFRNHFDVDRWADAYETNKTYGYVFTDPQYRIAVGVAAEIIFAQKFEILFDPSVYEMCKLGSEEIEQVRRAAEEIGLLDQIPKLRVPKEILGNSRIQVVTREVSKALREFEGVGGVRVDEARVRAWANQFPESLIPEALNMAAGIHVPTRAEFVDGVQQFLRETSDPRLTAIWVPLGALNDSGPHWAYYMGDVDDQAGVPKAVQLEHALRTGGPVVFFDDCIGTGGQVGDILSNWLGKDSKLNEDHGPPLPDDLKARLLQAELTFVFLSGPSSAKSSLEGICKSLDLKLKGVHVVQIWPDDGLTRLGIDLTSPLRNHLLKVGEQLLRSTKSGPKWDDARYRQCALGYGNRAQLLVFPTNVPTATVTAIWSEGVVDNRKWIPLVPRRPKKSKVSAPLR